MKYQVKIQYTNPSHEHVSLRRRVDTVTRLVEAANEAEAINRATRQQRSLGFMIKEAEVVYNGGQVQGIVHSNEPAKKKKIVGTGEEQTEIKKEPVKETNANEKTEKDKAKETESEVAVRKAMEKELAHNPHYKTESVATAQKVADRAAVVAKTAPNSRMRMAASSLGRKAQLRTINPTGVNTGIDRGAGNKATRKMGGVPKYQLDLDKKRTSVSEEAEQTDEAKKWSRAEWRMGTETDVDKNNKKIYDKLSATDPAKAKAFHDNLMRMKKKDAQEKVDEERPMSAPAYSSVSAKILTGKTDTNFGYAPNKMPPHLKAAQAASDELSKVVKRPQAGTLAALKKEETDNKLTKSRKAAEKMVNLAKSKANQINLQPTMDPYKTAAQMPAATTPGK